VSFYSILLAENQEIFRSGIRNTVCQIEDINICGEACNGCELLQLLNESSPDLIILEIELPKFKGLEGLKEIKNDHPQLKVLIVTKNKKRELIYLALNHGVDGYILKEEPCTEVIRAVEVIRQGGKFFSALLSSELMSFLSKKKQSGPRFSMREKEVLRHMSQGLRSREIAESLNISIFTVHRHCHNIKKKLQLHHMTDLIRYVALSKDNF